MDGYAWLDHIDRSTYVSCNILEHFVFRAVQKLYSIRDSMRIVSSARGRDVALHQLPFFYLTTNKNGNGGEGMERLEIVPNGGIGHGNRPRGSRRVLRGTKSPHEMRILYSLPQGKEITLRPFGDQHPFLLKANREYEFNLGMNKTRHIFSCEDAALQVLMSVRLCVSVCHPC